MELSSRNFMVDQCFIKSLKQLYLRRQKRLMYLAIRTMALLLAVPTNYLLLQGGRYESLSLLTLFILASLVYNTLEMVIEAHFLCVSLKDKKKIQQISIQAHHSRQINSSISSLNITASDQTESYEVDSIFNIKVSISYYDFVSQNKIDDVQEQFQIDRENKGEFIIKNALESTLFCYKCISSSFQLLSPLIMAAGFTIRTSMPLSQGQIGLLDLILITQLMLKPKAYAFLLLIVLTPFFIFVMFIYLCLKKKPKVNLPSRIPATEQQISKCTECSICFQSYEINEEIVVLPCSKVHIFHFGCINCWSKIKPNCPICRHSLCQ